jgi:hypothetical protein
MPGAQILICYDGSDRADCALDAAADLLGARRAVSWTWAAADHG